MLWMDGCVFVSVFMSVCMYVYRCLCMWVGMYVCMHARACARASWYVACVVRYAVYVRMHVCLYLSGCMHACAGT